MKAQPYGRQLKFLRSLIAGFAALCVSSAIAIAQEPPIDRALAQKLFVPGYSEILTHEQTTEPLASTLYIHNVDPVLSIVVGHIEYLDTKGELLKSHLENPRELKPFESMRILVPKRSVQNSHGGNFVVHWIAEDAAIVPLVEALIVGGNGTQGISFVSRARIIEQQ